MDGISSGHLLREAASVMLLVTTAGVSCLEFLCLFTTEASPATLLPALLAPSMLMACGTLMS